MSYSSRQVSLLRTHSLSGLGGFSLLEVMVVLVIIALLSGIVSINVKSHIDSGRQRKARADIAVLASQVKTFYANNGRYPSSSEGLGVLVPGYVEVLPLDPWGGEYQYENPGAERAFDIISFGADLREGGDGVDEDITNWSAADPSAK